MTCGVFGTVTTMAEQEETQGRRTMQGVAKPKDVHTSVR
jgi:hypothetical protein